MLGITDDQIATVLPKLAIPLARYVFLQDRAAKLVDPRNDPEFCKTFSGFYRIRARDEVWRTAYFGLLGELRGQPLDFYSCLTRLQAETGRLEASFTSKLLATLDPKLPVLDSIVLKHLGLKLPTWGAVQRAEKATNVYRSLTEKLTDCIHSDSGKRAISTFRRSYRDYQITDMKIIDLILWQTR